MHRLNTNKNEIFKKNINYIKIEAYGNIIIFFGNINVMSQIKGCKR
jgi:hypothetical protein